MAGNAIRDLQNTVKTVFNGLKAIMTDPIGAAKDAIKKIIGDIVGFFTGAKFTWPKIPMPHFIVKPSGWQIGDLLKGSIPSLDLQFYARGGLVDSPVNAIIGEAGPEAIVPLSRPAITPWAEEVAAVVGTDQTVSEKIEALHRDLYQIIRDAVPKDFSMNGRTWMEAREEAMAYR